jgi:capsular polysaccharide biosynthesis protein
VLGSALVTYLMPKTYAGVARVQLPNSKAMDVFRADATLQEVAEQLELSTIYAQRYGDAKKLSAERTLDILRRSYTVKRRWSGEHPVAEILVYDLDRRAAARMANTIAETGLSHVGYATEEQKEAALLERAIPARKPARPNWILNLALGAIVGTLLGLMAGGVGARVAVGLGHDLIKPQQTKR